VRQTVKAGQAPANIDAVLENSDSSGGRPTATPSATRNNSFLDEQNKNERRFCWKGTGTKSNGEFEFVTTGTLKL